MQKIIPHLWFDKEAKEAAEYYAATFPDSKVIHVSTLHDTPSGDADIVSFEIMGHRFMAISAGPLFKINPSISFLLHFETKEEVEELYAKLSEGGNTLMPLDSYPFSEKYAWVADTFGVSWQLIYNNGVAVTQRVKPMLMYVGENAGKTEEAINFYTSIFPNSSIGEIMRYGAGAEPDKEGTVQFAPFSLCNQEFAAMDSAHEHQFTFSEAVSLMVTCDTQEEIDRYWAALSAVPESEQCGWLKDKYGVSWQITPEVLDTLMKGSPEQVARVTQAFLKMKKFNIAELQAAAQG